MKPRHAIVISSFLALALVLGAASVVRTTSLGASAAKPKLTDAQIAAKNRQLARYETQLRKAAKQKPPALPKLPAVPRVELPPLPASSAPTLLAAGAPSVSSATTATAGAAPRVVYVRPAPIVRVVHRNGEGESGHDREGGGEHDGGSLDD